MLLAVDLPVFASSVAAPFPMITADPATAQLNQGIMDHNNAIAARNAAQQAAYEGELAKYQADKKRNDEETAKASQAQKTFEMQKQAYQTLIDHWPTKTQASGAQKPERPPIILNADQAGKKMCVNYKTEVGATLNIKVVKTCTPRQLEQAAGIAQASRREAAIESVASATSLESPATTEIRQTGFHYEPAPNGGRRIPICIDNKTGDRITCPPR